MQRHEIPTTVLKTLKSEEQYLLEAFFLRCLWTGPAAYVLFGEKPATIIGWRRTPGHSILAFSAHSSIYIEGYHVWKKIREHLPLNKKYLILCRENSNGDEVSITFINKAAFLTTVETHMEAVQEVLGKAMTAEKLLSKIEKNGGLTLGILDRHQGLLGLLLGYGKHNSWLWQRRRDLEMKTQRFSLNPKKAFPPLSKEEQEEIAKIESQLLLFGGEDPSPLKLLGLPIFITDPSDPESQELIDGYKYQRHHIANLFREGKYLETTLQKLCL